MQIRLVFVTNSEWEDITIEHGTEIFGGRFWQQCVWLPPVTNF
jgi:hypothetical protein